MSTEEHVRELKSRFIWESFVEMDVHATTVGTRELSDWGLFQPFLQTGDIPVVTSNLLRVDNGDRKPLGTEYEIIDVEGVRVGLIGLMGGSDFANASIPEDLELEFLDPLETLHRLVPFLETRTDVIVLMAHMQPALLQPLLETVDGVDVALCGARPSINLEPTTSDGTIVQQTGIRGQVLGRLTLIVDPQGDILDWGASNAQLMVDRWAPDLEMEAQIRDVLARSEEILAEVRESNRPDPAQRTSMERFLGAETCKRCHAAEYEQWASTAHARAFDTLHTDHGMEFTQECVSCHVTAFDEPNGFVSAGHDRPDLKHVQCESCHGPGTLHSRKGSVKVDEAVCLNCHTGEFAKDFDYDTYIEKVKH